MNNFTNLNELPPTELTPEELELLALKEQFITTDAADEEEPVAEEAPASTVH